MHLTLIFAPVPSSLRTCIDLVEMGCPENDTALNITIPVVMVSKSGGEEINKSMAGGEKGRPSYLILYVGIKGLVEQHEMIHI